MKTYLGVKIPRCNGRPQLWTRGYQNHESLRIIMPDGRVDWESWCGNLDLKVGADLLETWCNVKPDAPYMFACTEGDTQLEAIKNCIRFDNRSGIKGLFLGYL